MDQLKQLVRPITSGSRQAPDPYDQYLECRGLYRKHTARDASSLFRVIAEQLYDTQSLHYEIRLECVRFMTLKRRIFEKHIPGDYDSYLFDMSKPKTYGTMTELRAMCCLYKRNAILYEPYNMGTAVIFNRNFQHDFRVFYNNENHFDSVYEVDDIQAAAICQSITFKLLYQMLFKLPDVNFAVESMLHPHTFAWDPFDVVFDQQGYMIRIKCSDGRIFTLDLPEVTNCILEDFQLCNFHSSRGIQSRNRNLRQLLDQSQNPDMAGNVGDETRDRMLMCANKMVSCVRQLLDDGITPFPYKVAKSLDPNMYRNIEFDCWNDIRKEAKRHNAYCNDYNFKVGAKCRVELQHEVEMVTCHIQKISRDNSSCLVFLEKIGKMTLVPYDSLHPVPPDEFRPWTLPYRYQQRSLNRLPQMAQKFGNKSGHNNNKLAKWKKNKVVFEEANCFESTQYAPENHNNADQQQDGQNNIEQAQEPLEQQEDQEQASRAREREEGAKLQPQQQQKQVVKGYKATRQKNNSGSHHNKDPMVAVAMPPPGHFMGFTPSMIARPGAQPSPAWPNSPMAMPEEFQYPLQGPPLPPPTDGCVYMPIGSFAPHPTMPGQLLPLPPIPTPTNMAPAAVGVEPRRSMQMNGEDLPSDVGTLRYFYNMGVDMHLRMNHQPSPEELAVVPYIQQQGTPEKVEDHLAVEATPPATPEAGNGGTTEPLALEKSNSKRNGSPQTGKYRGKRPEQLHELKDPMGHAALLPTPTPSPGTNGNQFSFITPPPPPPPPQHLMTPPRLLQPPPIYYHKAGSGAPPQIPGVPGSPSQIPVLPAGQNPYAWGLPPPPPPSMVPHFEVINNFPIDAQQQQQQQQVAQVSAQQAGPQLPTLPAQSQPAANYGGAAPRHH